MSLCVNGEGDSGDPGGPRGDLYVVIREQEHKALSKLKAKQEGEGSLSSPAATTMCGPEDAAANVLRGGERCRSRRRERNRTSS